MAAEICLSQLPQLLADPNAEFQVRRAPREALWKEGPITVDQPSLPPLHMIDLNEVGSPALKYI